MEKFSIYAAEEIINKLDAGNMDQIKGNISTIITYILTLDNTHEDRKIKIIKKALQIFYDFHDLKNIKPPGFETVRHFCSNAAEVANHYGLTEEAENLEKRAQEIYKAQCAESTLLQHS